MRGRNKVWLGLLALILVMSARASAQKFSDWTRAVNVGPTVNSPLEETDPLISKDGLSLYFACKNCPGGYGGVDIWVARRASVEEPWGTPENLGSNINSGYDETSPRLSIDGHRLYFTSNRSGGLGGNDIYVSRRHDKGDDFGWQLPENLGEGVNTAANEAQAAVFEDEATGATILYFSSDRGGGLGGDDIYASALQPDETFGPAVLVAELSSSGQDRGVAVRRDGLEIFFVSNRAGSMLNLQNAPSFDLWTSTRESTADPWSMPVNVDPTGSSYINTRRHDGGPALSFDGTTLYFHAAQRTENVGAACTSPATFASCFFDVWVTTREKLHGRQ